MYEFQQKLKGLKERLKKWNKEEFRNIFADKKSLGSRLLEVQSKGMNEGYAPNLQKEEADLNAKIEEMEIQEDILWRQKSRSKWIKEGERNTSFFHHSITQRRMQNTILSLRNPEEVRVET